MKILRPEEEIIKNWKCNVSEPLVSIHCMAYNHEPYIEDALEGFLIQETDFVFEILIHDDASTDKTADIIRKYAIEYPNLIKPMYQSENQYSIGNRPSLNNQKRAKGKYIAFCEGDDYWSDPLKLHKQVQIFQSKPEYVMVYTDFTTVNKHGELIRKLFFEREHIRASGNIISNLINNNFIMTLTIMVKTDILLTAMSELNNVSCFFPIDYALFFEIAGMGPVYYLNENTGSYRVLMDSVSQRANIRGRFNFVINISYIGKYYNAKYHLGESDYFFDSRALTSILKECSKFKERGLFIRYFIKGVRKNIRTIFVLKIYVFFILSFIPKWNNHQQCS